MVYIVYSKYTYFMRKVKKEKKTPQKKKKKTFKLNLPEPTIDKIEVYQFTDLRLNCES